MFRRKLFRLRLRSGSLLLGQRTLIMGVLNVTPDSFSDGGHFFDFSSAIDHAIALQAAGADLLDIGAESTRPGAADIGAAEELRRLLPVLESLRKHRFKIPISVDTRRAIVAEAAIGAGAQILNDVSGLAYDPLIAKVAARHRAPLILMHMRGTPETMQQKPFARNVLRDVTTGLKNSIAIARKAGVPNTQIVIDPGIGFGKSYPQNYELLARLPELARFGLPLLVGASRKTFIGRALGGAPVTERVWGTAATVATSILGGAHIVRVHDVAEMVQVARVTDAILNPKLVSTQSQQR